MQSAITAATQFFDQPLAAKQSISILQSSAYRGYIRQAAENTAGVPDEREQVEFGREVTSPVLRSS